MENHSAQEIIKHLREQNELDAQRKSEQMRASMFEKKFDEAQANKNVNIFANNKKPQSVSLFNSKQAINLFQSKNTGGINLLKQGEQGAKNIFNPFQKPSIATEQDDKSLSEGSNSGIKSQNVFQTEPQIKEMKFDYKSQLVKLREFNIRKFKNGISPAKEETYVTLEKNPIQKGIIYLSLRNKVTKIAVYQGVLMKNISTLEHFMEKKENLRLQVVKKSRKEGKEGEQMIKQLVKMQFESEEDCSEFMRCVVENFSPNRIEGENT